MIGFAPSLSVGGTGPQRRALSACQKRPARRSFTMMADDKKNPLGGLGGLGDIMGAMKKAQEFQSSAKTLQEELKETEIEATVRDGGVKVIMSGQQHPLEVVVSDELAALGGSEVSKAVTECLVAAHSKRYVLFQFADHVCQSPIQVHVSDSSRMPLP